MNKFLKNAVIIAAVITAVVLLDRMQPAFAYDPAIGEPYGPDLINSFENNHGPAQQPPPVGSEQDINSWTGATMGPMVFPTPGMAVARPPYDTNAPGPLNGASYGRVTWTGMVGDSPQYFTLLSGAFENVGCSGVTTVAGDWSCFDYVRLNVHANYFANQNPMGAMTVGQSISFYDGSVTATAYSPVDIPFRGDFNPETWQDHVTVSLNFLANQNFNVSNVKEVILPAPNAEYDQLPLPGSAGPGSQSLVMYYDYLTLAASDAMPEYDSPPNITVKAAVSGGAYITWDPLPAAQTTPGIPVTAYHIFRSSNIGTGGPPYVSYGIAPLSVTGVVDNSVAGGAVYCYKILTCINGPILGLGDERLNTINATYHEPLLSQAGEVCGYVNPPPTKTDTPTVTPTVTETVTDTWTCTDSPTVTRTPSPTFTATNTETNTPTLTQTSISSETGTNTGTMTVTLTSTDTASRTYTPTRTVTLTATLPATATLTETQTQTPLPTPTMEDNLFINFNSTVYPNPAKAGDNVYMLYNAQGSAEMTVTFFTIDGRKAKEHTENISGRGRSMIEVQNLAPGVYLYVVKYKYPGREEKSKVKKLFLSR